MKLWEVIKKHLIKQKDKTFREADRVYHYDEILLKAEKLAEKLTYPCYGILCSSELNSSIALLACLAAESIAIPLSHRYGEAHCRRIIDCATLRYLIVDDESGEIAVAQISDNDFKMPEGQKPSLIMFTSGTTGSPKGAMISQENLLCNLYDIHKYFNISSKDTILISRPLYHCAVLTGEFLISILCGLDIVFYSGNFNPYALCQTIGKYQITVAAGTPTLFYHAAQMEKRLHKCSSLRVIVTSGECMTPTVATSIRSAFKNVHIYNVYGLTEASPRVSYLPPPLFNEFCTSVGFPLASLQVKILSKEGDEVAPGVDGELVVKGDSVMIGYYNDEEMTARRICDGWLYTGDIASMTEEGLITIKCRKDNMIIKAGINIYPQEIENAIKQCDGVSEAYVYADKDTQGRTIIHLMAEGSDIDEFAIAKYCRKHLPTYEVPDDIRIVDEIPKNGSGKIIRKHTCT